MIRIIRSAQLSTILPPKPKEFIGSDEEWAALNNVDTDQNSVPDWKDKQETVQQQERDESAGVPTVDDLLRQQPAPTPEPVVEESKPAVPLIPEPQAPVQPEQMELPEPVPQIPDYLGEEESFEPEEQKTEPKPEVPADDVPTGISNKDIPKEYQEVTEDFDKISPREENEPVDPAAMFEEVLPKDTPTDDLNKKYSIKEKIWHALNNGSKLTINYDTIGNKNPSVNVNRTIDPQYVAFNNRTNRFLLFTQPDSGNMEAYGPTEGDGWKSFAIDNIKEAKLEE